MDLKNIIIIVSAIINLFLGFFILQKGQNKIVNKLYALIAFSVCFWGLGMVLYRSSLTIDVSLLWCRILYLAPIFIVGSFLLFSYVFPEGKEKIKKSIIATVVIVGSAIFWLTIFTDKIIKSIIFASGEEKTIVFGQQYFLYSLFISVFFIWAYVNLLIRRHKSSGIFRVQISYVFWGTFLASTLGMITNLILPTFGVFSLNWAGQILSLIMVVFIAYAIIVHRLLDIKLALRRSIVYVLSVVAVAVPASGVLYLVNQFAPEYATYASIAVLIAAVSVFSPIRDYYYRVANKYFFSSLYDSREVISRVSDGLRSTLEITEIHDFIAQVLMGSLHTKAVSILNYDSLKKEYIVQFDNGFSFGSRKNFPKDSGLQEEYGKQSKIMVVEEIKATAYRRHKEVVDLLISVNVAAVVPLNVKNEILGVIFLGLKESGDMYNDEDLRTLETIASQAAMAIKNAQLYEEAKGFSLTLQQEVERQTKELKQANEDLKKLDKAKSDFISIASHQLRTPLTAIKGFTSMILEGSYGRTTKVVHDKLEKIYESAERLIRLVNDLLDLSHMEGGKMEFDFQKINLTQMVKSVAEELDIQAQKKKLKLIVDLGERDLFVKADEQKLRQVVMNLIDNAVKYTEKGEVKVSVKEVSNKIQFAIKDTGMGMKPEEINSLFQKFVRGSEASHYHTEGAGIGLYVARQLIEAHQGRVWAESEGEGKGSTFFVEIAEWQN